jgi:tetrapyrrole methylase family protein/MazG family protein
VSFRVVTLTLGQPDADLVSSLSGFTVVSPSPDHFSIREIGELGIVVSPLTGEELTDQHVLLLPPAASSLDHLVKIVDRLLGPGGCPWDQAQTHDSLKKYLLEESYEVIEAIEMNSSSALEEELGDLLLQPVMHGQIESLAGGFDTFDAAQGIVDKLIRRHPHVFGTVVADSADEVLRNWDQIKKEEKGASPTSILSGVPRAMPALQRAYEVSKRAGRAGFEWPSIDEVFAKVREEENELREAIAGGNQQEVESELGDIFFTFVNVARWAKIEPEEALRKMVDRFSRRFQSMESEATKPLTQLTLAEWDELWLQAKKAERRVHVSEDSGSA